MIQTKKYDNKLAQLDSKYDGLIKAICGYEAYNDDVQEVEGATKVDIAN